ncbi:class I SAM-dependent methyltransferase [Evansella tamaricis]|uniref:SAM-dependent methyltransferase n=1 Tax=Evansella tamaricis TaxID=2069301 RepID=A0ABS6JF07_9BACI|nr:SAM-dependent methyltransferase [Evansella tamaricis]MBU9712244.1 SAM-dependent methyltransferase [Evansella tamaricis]
MGVIEKLKKKSASPWSFSLYMETALYDPEYGYYKKDHIKLGKEGDFYTSNHVHPVFAKTFARFFSDVIKKEGLFPVICEWGAGDGRFARNVLSCLKENDGDLFEKVQYLIVETSPYHQRGIQETVGELYDKIQMFQDFEEVRQKLPSFNGIIFSNELIDAFPVDVVEKTESGYLEVKVDLVEGTLKEKLVPCSNKDIIHWLDHYGPELPLQHRTEINLSMKEWLRQVASWVNHGIIVTVDYGYSNNELIAPERRDGSLRGYYQHQMINNPLQYPGEMDLTSHIQWDAFRKILRENNFSEIFHERQDKFLLKAGLFTFLEEVKDYHPFSETFKLNRAIQTLVQPGGISSSFQVNIQGKNVVHSENYGLFNEDPYQINK